MADPHAGHVGDRVVLAGGHRAERQSELAGPRARWRRWHAPSLPGRNDPSGADLSSGDARGAADAGGLEPIAIAATPRRRLLARRARARRRGARARRRAPRPARRRPATRSSTPPDLGLDPITAVHDAEFVDFLSRALRVMGRRRPPRRSRPAAGRAVPVRHRAVRPPATSPGGGRRRSAPRSGCTRWTRCRCSARARSTPRAAPCTPRSTPPTSSPTERRPPTPRCAHPGTTPARRSSAAPATSTTPPPPPSGCAPPAVERVAIVDIDAHQGNGTQEIFWERADVLYASVHVDPGAGWFPHLVGYADERGGGDGEGWNVNVPLPAGRRRRAVARRAATVARRRRAPPIRRRWSCRSASMPRPTIRPPAAGHRRRVPRRRRVARRARVCRRCSCRKAATSSTSSPPWWSRC